MLKRILKFSASLITSITLIISALFAASSSLQAMPAQDNIDNSPETIIQPSDEQSKESVSEPMNTSKAPDLGDEQVFPFIAGFGKNSGKD